MLKCKICGTEFPPVMDKHYIARENGIQGGLVQLSNGKQEEKYTMRLTAQCAAAKL